jgi:hypothetical protein
MRRSAPEDNTQGFQWREKTEKYLELLKIRD